MSSVRYESTTAASAKPTSAMRSMPSGFCRTKFRISSVAREKRDGGMSRARIEAERSSTTIRSARSYSGNRWVTVACGRIAATAIEPTTSTPAMSTPASRTRDDRRDRPAKRGAMARRRRNARRNRRWIIQQAATSGTASAQGARSGRRKVIAARGSSDVAARPGAWARLGAQQLHQLVRRGPRLPAERRRETRDELEVVLRIPVGRLHLDGAPELLFGARQPAELFLGLAVAAALRVVREPGPEVGRGRVGRALRLLDHLVVALEPVVDPELRRDDVGVLARDQLADDGDAVEPRFGERVRGPRAIPVAGREGLVSLRDRPRPARGGDRGRARDEQQQHQRRSDRSLRGHHGRPGLQQKGAGASIGPSPKVRPIPP